MNFEVKKEDKYTVITVTAEKLDGNIAPLLKSEFVMLTSEGVKSIILDLSTPRYCDSSGLSAILVGNRQCKNAGGTFVITGLQPSVMKLISISQLDSILNITPTVSEAVDMIFMEEVERDLGSQE